MPARLLRAAFLALPALVACENAPVTDPPRDTTPELAVRPPLANAADSLAWRITEAAGGLDAWNALPLLRFDWAVVRDTGETFRAKHLWDRRSGRYRVEYRTGEDSLLVAVFDARRFDPSAPEGMATLNGALLDSTAAREHLTEAYERYINDSYWLLAPLKLFDPGVRRALAPDSADAETDVLLLSFEDVGLTPGDRYWLRADSTGRLVAWMFLLEGNTTGLASRFAWSDYTALPTPGGSLVLARRKSRGSRAIVTEPFAADSLGTDVFDDPRPRL